MPVIMREATIGANTTVENTLSGSAYEFTRGAGVVSFGVAGAATGLIDNIQAGASIVAEAFPCPILTRYPILPDEFYFNEVVMGGDRLVVRAQNTTGAGIVHRVVAQITYQG